MRIFLSYSRADEEQAKLIFLTLKDQGHRVFYDRNDLPAGEEYHNRIRSAIERAHLFVFLAGPAALDAGSYTLTELEIAEKCRVRLLPVLINGATIAELPPALKNVTVIDSRGNVPASVGAHVYRVAKERRRRWLTRTTFAICIAMLVGLALVYDRYRRRETALAEVDGAPLALIAAGVFVMGDDEESPRREIYLDSFYLDRFEVTVGRYGRFLQATGNSIKPDHWPESDLPLVSDFAVVGVSWHDADAYCRWARRRLPTEAEWERAARTGDKRKYPWGSVEPTTAHARFAVSATNAVYPDGVAKVGNHPAGATAAGIHDLAGNAAEWVKDWYAPGILRAQARNPQGPERGTGKVVRGGGWMDSAARITATKRMYLDPDQRMMDVGFRCARDAK